MRIPFFASAAIGLLSLAAHQAHAGSPEIVKLEQNKPVQNQSVTENLSYFIQPSSQSDFHYFGIDNSNQTLDWGLNFNSFSITSSILNIGNDIINDEKLDIEPPNISFNYYFGQGSLSLGYSSEKFEIGDQPFVTSYNTNIDVEYNLSDSFDIYTSLQLNEFDEYGDSQKLQNDTTVILGTSVSF